VGSTAPVLQVYQPNNPDDPFRQAVAALLSQVDPEAATRYRNCHIEGHGWVEYCPHNVNHYQRFIPCSCMLRICNYCSEYLAGQIRSKYRPVFEALEGRERPGWSLKLITLTRSVSLAQDIGQEVLKTLDSAHTLYNRLWGSVDGAGGLASLEVGEHGQKIHVHMIVYGGFYWKSEVTERASKSKQYSPIIALACLASLSPAMIACVTAHAFWGVVISGGPYVSETWETLTGDYIVDVQRTSAERAVKEGLKYVTKFVSLSPQQLVDLHVALKGRRRIRSWGVFYGIGEDDDTAEIRACPACNEALEVVTELRFVFMLLEAQDAALSILDLTEANKSPPEQVPKLPDFVNMPLPI
jgi:hypothetical protein